MGEGVRRYAASMQMNRRIVALAIAFVAALPFACNASAPPVAPESAITIPAVSSAPPAVADASAQVVADDTPPTAPDASRDDAGASVYGDPDAASSFGIGGPGLGVGGVSIGLGDGGFGIGLGPRDAGGKVIKLRVGPTEVKGRLPPEVIQRIVRQNFGRFRLCYETGLKTKPKLAGRITVRFVIERMGAVSSARNDGSTIADVPMLQCVVRTFASLAFPQPEDGADVTVKYSVDFAFD